MQRRKTGFSARQLAAAELSQVLGKTPFLRHPYDHVRGRTTGSVSPNWIRPDYHTAKRVVLSPGADWLFAESNPEAKRLPASWKRAVIAGVGRAALDELIEEQVESGAEVDTAVAYLGGGGKAHFAILPDGFGMLPKTNEHPEDNYAVAMRQGQGPTTVAPCLWRPRDRAILIPAGSFIVAQLVPTVPDLARDYHRVPLA